MTEQQWIKKRKWEFERLYGKEMRVEVLETLATEQDLEQELVKCVEKYNASLEKIRSGKRLHSFDMTKERAAVIEFLRIVFYNSWNYRVAAQILNKDRTTIVHFIKKLQK